MTSIWTVALGAAICTAAVVVVSTTSARNGRVDRGRALLKQHCASCHAIGRTGESPLRTAPAFRKMADRLDMNELMLRMQDRLVSGHRDMPAFRFNHEDARAIRSYLNAIQLD